MYVIYYIRTYMQYLCSIRTHFYIFAYIHAYTAALVLEANGVWPAFNIHTCVRSYVHI